MGAAEVLTDPSSLYESNYMGKGDLSDTDMVITVRNTLASVQNVSVYASFLWLCVFTYVDAIFCFMLLGGIIPLR